MRPTALGAGSSSVGIAIALRFPKHPASDREQSVHHRMEGLRNLKGLFQCAHHLPTRQGG